MGRTISIVSFALLFICSCSKHGKTGVIPSSIREIESVPLAHIPRTKSLLPKNVDLSSDMPPAGYQDLKGACVAFCIGYDVISFYEKVFNKYDFNIKGHQPDPSKVFSPAFIFNEIKAEQHQSDCSEGIKFTSAMKFVQAKGICRLLDFPYNGKTETCDAPPSGNEYRKAQNYNYYEFYRLEHNLDDIINVLSDGVPVMFSFATSENMDNDGYSFFQGSAYYQKLPFIWKPSNDDFSSLHAMVLVGYQEKQKLFKALNSWDVDWGNDGYCYIPATVLMDRIIEIYFCQPRTTQTKGLIGHNFAGNKVDTTPIDSISNNERSAIKARIFNMVTMLEKQNKLTSKQEQLLRDLKSQ